jgi:hypothetical protein
MLNTLIMLFALLVLKGVRVFVMILITERHLPSLAQCSCNHCRTISYNNYPHAQPRERAIFSNMEYYLYYRLKLSIIKLRELVITRLGHQINFTTYKSFSHLIPID